MLRAKMRKKRRAVFNQEDGHERHHGFKTSREGAGVRCVSDSHGYNAEDATTSQRSSNSEKASIDIYMRGNIQYWRRKLINRKNVHNRQKKCIMYGEWGSARANAEYENG